MPKVRKTRSSPASWLIGGATPKLCHENRLPTLRSVLQYVLHLHETQTIRDACRHAVEELLPRWDKAGVPCLHKRDATSKLLKYFQEWIELKRSINRPLSKRREQFTAALDKLFDIGVRDADKRIIHEEDKAFYKSMQEDRVASMLSVDRKWAKKLENKQKRAEGLQRLKRRSDEETLALFQTTSGGDAVEDNSQEPATGENEEEEFQVPVKRKRKTLKVLRKDVTSALDRTQTSDKFAAHIIKKTVSETLRAVADNLGIEEEMLDFKPRCSSKTVRKQRCDNRKSVATSVMQALAAEPGPFTLHFDSKILPEDGKKYDRLPVLVTGPNTEQLLGVPRLDHGTGQAEADATYTLVTSWGIQDKIIATAFDTAAVNTGCEKGCCTRLKEKLKKDLLDCACACRHHVQELVLDASATDLLGESKDPRLPFFAMLDTNWDKLKKDSYRTAASSRKLKLIPEADEVVVFCQRELQVKQPRGDYRELLELAIVFLGGVVQGKSPYTFKKPGCLSKTRWMARAIYALKTWMFGRMLKLSSSDDAKLLKLNVFIVRAYLRPWFRSRFAAQAPRNELNLLQTLYRNKSEGSHWQAALAKFANHLWYLSPKMVCLSLFDAQVSVEEKKAIVLAMEGRDGSDGTQTRGKVVLDDRLLHLRLQDFASTASKQFFETAGISQNFLAKDPVIWANDSDFQAGLRIVNGLQVVNDCAERAVQLITRYLKGNKLTNDENQRQLLMLVVAEDRKRNKVS